MGKYFVEVTKTRDKQEYLQAVLHRIEDDIDPYVKYLKSVIEKEKRGPGVFALIRMVFPIIESVARPMGMTQQELLKVLNVPLPYLFWAVFRDGFIHNDEFLQYEYNGNKVEVGIVTGKEGEIVVHHAYKGSIILSPFKLINDLKNFLIQNSEDEGGNLQITDTIQYSDPSKLNGDDEIKKEELANIVKDIIKLKRSSKKV